MIRSLAILGFVFSCMLVVAPAANGQPPSIPKIISQLHLGSAEQKLDLLLKVSEADLQAAKPIVVQALTKRLKDSNAKVRAATARVLGRIATGDVQVAESLIEIASDSDPDVRKSVLRALIDLKAPRELTLPIWVKTMQGTDHDIIMEVIHTMAELGAAAVPPLRDALKHPEAAYWGCLIAEELGPVAAPAIPELLELVNHAHGEIQLHAVMALGRIGGDDERVPTELIGVLTGDAELALKYAACFALSQLPPNQQAAETLAATLNKAADVELKLLAGWSLLMLQPDSGERDTALTAIIAGLQSDQPRIQQLAVRALGDIRPSKDGPSKKVVAAMIKTLESDNNAIISQVNNILVSKGAESLPVVKTGLANPVMRPHAVEVARRLGPLAATLTSDLVDIMSEQDLADELHREVHFAIGAIGPDAAEAIPVLIQSLDGDNSQVRASACYALGKIGDAAKQASEQLMACTEEEDPFLQLAAVWSLLEINGQSPELIEKALPLLTKALSMENEFIRIEAARSLGKLGGAASSATGALKELLTDESSIVRAAAAQALDEVDR